ncbi:MAG: cellulase family glycosylhydrolase [Phycisphaeraceae bacterium]|nr:cellulase family glycosylhydrolase [Phycisphaeraceae bacterium]
MSSYALLSVLLMGCLASRKSVPFTEEIQRGDVIFEANFEGGHPLVNWPRGTLSSDGFQSEHALCIERRASSNKAVDNTPSLSLNAQILVETGQLETAYVESFLSVKKFRGYTLSFSAMIKAQDVTQKPKRWNGIKFAARFVMADGTEGRGDNTWPGIMIDTGTFDWRLCAFKVVVPQNATRMILTVGLDSVAGKVWFDNLKGSVRKAPLPPVVLGIKNALANKKYGRTRLRGVMLSDHVATEENLRVLGQEWNVNLVYFHSSFPSTSKVVPATYDAWLQAEMQKLDAVLPICKKYGIKVALGLYFPPGSEGLRTGRGEVVFHSLKNQKKLVWVWEQFAEHYKNSDVIWGYDLVGEPIERNVAEDAEDWQDLSERLAKAIRAIDTKHFILIEPPGGDDARAIQKLRPIDVSNVVYNIHMYAPHPFTHQGIYSGFAKAGVYPGEFQGKYWDKAQMQEWLKPVFEFQKKYEVPIFLGEFSAVRWAPDNSAYRYIKDIIEIAEEHDWNWVYHCFRSYHGWSVEHDEVREHTAPATSPTDREKLLRKWFSKNQKP